MYLKNEQPLFERDTEEKQTCFAFILLLVVQYVTNILNFLPRISKKMRKIRETTAN